MSKERLFGHHNIALSIGGVHYLPSGRVLSENLIMIDEHSHNLIHKTLNIPYNLIREFRKKHEWKLHKDVSYYEDLKFLQSSYFMRLEYLPEDLQRMMYVSMRAQVPVVAHEYHYHHDLHQSASFLDYSIGTRFYLAIYQKIFLDLATKHSNNKFT